MSLGFMGVVELNGRVHDCPLSLDALPLELFDPSEEFVDFDLTCFPGSTGLGLLLAVTGKLLVEPLVEFWDQREERRARAAKVRTSHMMGGRPSFIWVFDIQMVRSGWRDNRDRALQTQGRAVRSTLHFRRVSESVRI